MDTWEALWDIRREFPVSWQELIHICRVFDEQPYIFHGRIPAVAVFRSIPLRCSQNCSRQVEPPQVTFCVWTNTIFPPPAVSTVFIDEGRLVFRPPFCAKFYEICAPFCPKLYEAGNVASFTGPHLKYISFLVTPAMFSILREIDAAGGHWSARVSRWFPMRYRRLRDWLLFQLKRWMPTEVAFLVCEFLDPASPHPGTISCASGECWLCGCRGGCSCW